MLCSWEDNSKLLEVFGLPSPTTLRAFQTEINAALCRPFRSLQGGLCLCLLESKFHFFLGRILYRLSSWRCAVCVRFGGGLAVGRCGHRANHTERRQSHAGLTDRRRSHDTATSRLVVCRQALASESNSPINSTVTQDGLLGRRLSIVTWSISI